MSPTLNGFSFAQIHGAYTLFLGLHSLTNSQFPCLFCTQLIDLLFDCCSAEPGAFLILQINRFVMIRSLVYGSRCLGIKA